MTARAATPLAANRYAQEPIHIISLGAGVQSSTMALMAAAGEITPMPSFAVFADTGDEPGGVYRWLSKLESMIPFKVIRCQHPKGSLSSNLFARGFSQIPAYQKTGKGVSIGKRQCTSKWKIIPVNRAIRAAIGATGKRLAAGSVVVWKGISVDEAHRMKPSRDAWQIARFPLIEKGLSRADCLQWLSALGISAPRSACVFCPFKSDSEWTVTMAGENRESVIAIDRQLNLRGEYLHRSCVPINEVSFKGLEPWFGNECEGMCGV